MRAAESAVQTVSIRWEDSEQNVLVATHDGHVVIDTRPLARLICPVRSIGYQGEVFEVQGAMPGELTTRLYDEITGIQYGKLPDRHGWTVRVPLPA